MLSMRFVPWSVMVLWLAGSGCIGSSSNPYGSGTVTNVTVNETDNGGKVSLPVGGILTVKLPSNPATGYQWALLGFTAPDVLAKVDNTYVPSPTPQDAAGAGGTEVWRFNALTPDATILEMQYLPAVPGIAPATNTFNLTVTVVPGTQSSSASTYVQIIPNSYFTNFSNNFFNFGNFPASLFNNPAPTPVPLPPPTPLGSSSR